MGEAYAQVIIPRLELPTLYTNFRSELKRLVTAVLLIRK